MKKYKISVVIAILLTAATAAALVGCTDDRVAIEDYAWRIETVIVGGDVVYASEEKAELYPSALPIEGTMYAADGKLTAVIDGKEYSGSYESIGKGGKEINYSVGLFAEGKQEYAVTAYTEYNDGSRTPTLVLSLPGEDGYAVYFYGAEKDKEN